MALLSQACGLREARQQQKVREATEAAKRSAELSHQLNRKFQDDAADVARRDLNDRIRYVRALIGDYEGGFTSFSGHEAGILAGSYSGRIHVSVAATNLPAPFKDERPIDQSYIQNQMEAIALTVEIMEESTAKPEVMVYCVQTGIKPEYDAGIIRITCQNAGNAPSREYLFTLDDEELNAELTAEENTVYQRSGRTSLGIIDGRVPRVNRLNLRISSPFGRVFHGQATRLGDRTL